MHSIDFHMKMDHGLFDKLKMQADAECRTMSEIVRGIIVIYLKNENKNGLEKISERLNSDK